MTPRLSAVRAVRTTILAAFAIAGLGSNCVRAQDRNPIGVNAKLAEFHQQFARPELVDVGAGVRVAFGYGLANFTFIETAHGLIVIDTGWFAHEMDSALADLRKLTRKPVVAVIYTHSHSDHTGGAGELGDLKGIPVYAPEGFGADEWAESRRQFTPQLVRAYSQLGLMLKGVGENAVGGGVGPSPRAGPRAYIAPNRFVAKREQVEIDGLRLVLVPSAMDVRAGLMVWLPAKKILFSGDTVTGVLTILETPRYVPSRAPDLMAKSFDAALELKPDVVVPGHGRLLLGSDDVEAVLSANRDLSNFLIDQVDRRIELGQDVETIVHDITLPEALANNPDLQPYYHRREWIIRSLVAKRVGWYTELYDLVRPDGVEGTRKIAALVGFDKLESAFDQGIADKDYRWAAQISYFLKSARGNEADTRRWQEALRGIAATTTSVNERSYLISDLATEAGRIHWRDTLREQHLSFARGLGSRELVDLLRMRIDPDNVRGERRAFRLQIQDTSENFDLLLENGALMFAERPADIPAHTINMTRQQLDAMFADGVVWQFN